MFLGVSLIVCGDTAGKALGGMGVHPFVIAWMRFALGLILLAPFLGPVRANIARLPDRWLILRGALIAGAISSILTALRTEPIANVFGAFFVGPVVSYVLSRLVLQERTTWLRSLLIVTGFVGVLMVVQPGTGFRPNMIFALLAGSLYGCFLALTRRMTAHHGNGAMLFSQLFWGMVVLTPFAVFHAGSVSAATSGTGVMLIVISALASAVGNHLIVRMSRTAPGTVVAPLIYLQLISAAIMGWLVFDALPNLLATAGLVVIAASGLASLWFARAELGR